jgi:hypothetical protein
MSYDEWTWKTTKVIAKGADGGVGGQQSLVSKHLSCSRHTAIPVSPLSTLLETGAFADSQRCPWTLKSLAFIKASSVPAHHFCNLSQLRYLHNSHLFSYSLVTLFCSLPTFSISSLSSLHPFHQIHITLNSLTTTSGEICSHGWIHRHRSYTMGSYTVSFRIQLFQMIIKMLIH